MAKELTTRMTLRLMATYTDAIDLSVPSDSLDKSYADVLATGGGDNQSDRLYHDTHTINNATYLWDLTTVTDAFGDVLGWNALRGLILYNASIVATEYAELVLHDETGALVTNEVSLGVVAGTLTDEVVKMKINPDGIIFLWAPVDGWLIDATHKNICVTTATSGDSCDVDIIAIGTT